jgi:hypothetical protein
VFLEGGKKKLLPQINGQKSSAPPAEGGAVMADFIANLL